MGKAEKTRQFIIEQSATIFNQKGIAGTTIDDILIATKMAKGGLYGHFKSKEEIAEVMVDFLLGKMVDKIAAMMNKQQTAVGKVFAFMDVYKNPLTSYIEGGCPILNFGVEADDTNPVIKQKVKTVIEDGQKVLIAALNQGVANKQLSPSLNTEEFALKTFAALEGGIMISRVTGSNKYMASLISMLKTELKTFELN